MSDPTLIQSRESVAYLKPVGQLVSLEPLADSGLGDELHSRQERSGPAALQRCVARLMARQQELANAVKEYGRQLALQPTNAPAGKAVAPGQDDVLETFWADHALKLVSNAALERQWEVIRDKAAAVKQQSHLLEAQLREFASNDAADTPAARAFADNTLAQLRQLAVPEPLVLESLNQPKASADFFEQLLAMIGLIREDYLAVYEALLDKYSNFYKEFNTEIMSKMGDWVNGIEDGKKVQLDPGISVAIKAMLQKYSAIPAGMLFPVVDEDKQTWTPATKDEAEKWAEALGLDPKKAVVSDGRGGFCVKMDLSTLIAMDDALQFPRNPAYCSIFDPNCKEPEFLPMKWDTAKYQAWNTGFTNQEGDLKNQLQMFTTKYGNANSYHENFNKILSSQLSQYAEMLKAIASGIA